jgi:hypothetical protein
MNAKQIKDEIRKLNRIDKIAIYRWLDVYRWIDEEAAVVLLLMIDMSAVEKSHDLHGRN